MVNTILLVETCSAKYLLLLITITNNTISFTSGGWLKRCYNGVCGEYMQSKDIVIIRQNNVPLCRPLSSSMETASSQFSKGNISWTACVTMDNSAACHIPEL